MADVQATFGIEIPVATNAASAAVDLEALQDQLDADTASLRSMQRALRDLQGGTAVSIDQFRGLRTQIAAQKQAIAGSTSAIAAQEGGFKKLTRAQKESIDKAKRFREEEEKLKKTRSNELASGQAHLLGILSPRLGHAARAAQDFGQALKTVGAARAVSVGTLAAVSAVAIAAVVAFVALTYAVGRATIALVEFGLASANARRDEKLMLQASSATLFWGAATEQAGKQAQLAVDNVARSVPIAREQVAGFAAQLAKAQLKGQDLQKALRAVSVAASTGQDASGLIGAFSAIRFVGGSVDALSKRVEDKFGHIVKAQMLSLNVQSVKLKENLGHLFDKVKIEPFLEALQDLLSVFDSTKVTGYVMREVLGDLFDVAGRGAKSATPTLKTMFKIFLIGVLSVVIAILKLKRTFDDIDDGLKRLTGSTKKFNTAWELLKAAFAASGQSLLGPFAPVIDAFNLLSVGFEWLKTEWSVIKKVWDQIDLSEAAVRIVDGLVDGIKKGAAKFVNAVKDLGRAGIKAFKSIWEINSPSGVARDMAHQIGAGTVRGTDDVRPRVAQALGDAVQPPEVPAARGGGGARGGDVNVTVQVTVTGADAKDAPGLASNLTAALEPQLGELFERLVRQSGGKLAAA